MASAMFGYPLPLGDEWEDRSVHTYYLKDGGVSAAAVPSFSLAASGRQGATFTPNLVVIREPRGDRTLEAAAAEHRKAILQRLEPRDLGTEPIVIAGASATARAHAVTLQHPLPPLCQLLATVARDGYFYHFCATTTQARFDRDKPRFRALMESWS